MKKYIVLIVISIVSLFLVRNTIAQENVQQVLDIACIAKDVASLKYCVQQVQAGTTDFIKITEMIECKSQDDCAFRLSDIKRTVLIYGLGNTGAGFKRINNFNYSIFTIQNSEKVSLGSFFIDDTSQQTCTFGTVCPPVITIQNSTQILIESLITKSVKNTAVFVQGSKNTIIKKSLFDNSEKHAVDIQGSSDTVLESNTFKNSHSHGVVFSSQGKNSIINNSFTHNNHATFSSGCGSVCTGAQLQVLPNTGDLLIRKNIVKEGRIEVYGGFGLTASGIEVAGQNIGNISLTCNTIVENTGSAIVQINRDTSAQKIEISNNTIMNNGIDINVVPTQSDIIEKNCFIASCRVEGC